MLIVLVAAVVSVAMGTRVTRDYCYPGASCYPSTQQFADLNTSLDGTVLFPHNSQYQKLVFMKNSAYNEYPAAIVLVSTVQDIQKCLKFAHDHNMKISIQSSGHDLIGRSTATGSLQINLSNMTDININLASPRHPAGEITVESGNNWLRVYAAVDKVGRVIVGGSSHTVAMGGYTLGGGHSPISKLYGLAVDNLLEVELVVANGSVVIANDVMTKIIDTSGKETVSIDTSLFWALRGGGGGTFGVVSKFTFKLHMAPNAVQSAKCVFNLYQNNQPIGLGMLKHWNQVETYLAPEWGGYYFLNGDRLPYANLSGTVTIVLNHMGEWGSPSFNKLKAFTRYYEYFTDYKICKFANYTSFYEYVTNTTETPFTSFYEVSTLVQRGTITDQFYATILSALMFQPTESSSFTCAATLLGGKVRDVGPDETPLNPAFRNAMNSFTCQLNFQSLDVTKHMNITKQFAKTFLKFGEGTYLNEASEYLPNWKTAYWGNHYGKLLEIKRTWDPTNVFSCYHCVGSDTMTPGGQPPIG